MKAQERSATPPEPEGSSPARAATGEWDGKVVAMDDDFVELDENTERAAVPAMRMRPSRSPRVRRAMRTCRASAARPSSRPFPRSWRSPWATIRDPAGPAVVRPWSEVRDPVLPPPSGTPRSHTPVYSCADASRGHAPGRAEEVATLESDESIDTYSVEFFDEPAMPPLEQVRSLVESARSHMDRGNLGAAVIAADQALAEAGKTSENEVVDLVKTSRPLFDRIFAAYVGLLSQVPVRARSDEEIAGQELGERTRYLLNSIDGKQTLEQLAVTTGIPPVEAMKLAASLLAAGIVRVS